MTDSYATVTTHFETIIDFLRFGISQAETANLYYGHGTDNAWDDMLALILTSLSLPIDCDPMLLQARLTAAEKQTLAYRLSRRIIDKLPVPYLTNEAYFCDLPFYVDERVLIPRSPIAELIKQQFSPWLEAERVERILDLCTGSACIAIACNYAFPDAHVDAVDISSEALEVAEINRERHGVQEVLTLIQSDCWSEVPKKHYDLIVSNPPYVGAEEMLTLPEEYLHEPRLALETKNNGLAIVEKILANAHDYLTEDGILVVEVGNSDEALVNAFPQIPFTWLDFEHGGHGVFLLTRQQLAAHFASTGN
ncbi:N5-glutamine S-adenosyl-L-methionine-dependent methyltransferase [Legionella nautarum]|uniref:Ribosomal protein uL3 glutamine methyltransferase n=1 Tax=Legionella nautarum TaxID=45070 RepID=A0A0W0WKW4_9GAMM|nr:50S ribosomal protein L3 N(5)-glutamine methyltransferase [Legionella nautarum]KTD32973.1 N5-glutamine S-adenosyl-L-methionine-dependent methyltransferase [Legionella nautarum]